MIKSSIKPICLCEISEEELTAPKMNSWMRSLT
jgi:hypothetical protein